MQTRKMPVRLVDPNTQEELINYNAEIPVQNYSQPLDMSVINKAANAPIVNTKQAAFSSMLEAMPMQLSGLSVGSDKAYKYAMPIINQLMSGKVAADENVANIANEQTKRQTMAMLYNELGKQENAKNFGIVESALQALTGAKVDPTYAGLTFVNPTTELQAANAAAAKQLDANMNKAQMDNSMAIAMANIAASRERATAAAQQQQGVDPRLFQWAGHAHNKTLTDIISNQEMDDNAKKAAIQSYVKYELPSYSSANPAVARSAANDVYAALKYIDPQYADEWLANFAGKTKPNQGG